jgi:hypothetical protein
MVRKFLSWLDPLAQYVATSATRETSVEHQSRNEHVVVRVETWMSFFMEFSLPLRDEREAFVVWLIS